MEKIVFLDRSALQAPLRKPCFEHLWEEYPTTASEQVAARLAGATIAVTDRVPLGEAELARLPQLRHIAVAATGVDGIDLAACRRRGISVSNVRDWAVSVPEHVFALMLALRRNLLAYHEAVQGGGWQKAEGYTLLLEPPLLALNGSTLGLIGHGGLGQGVAALAEAFGMEVLVAEHKGAREVRPGRVSFPEVLERSDVLVLLCPLNEQTAGLVGKAELALLPRHALLINCARGALIDEAALAAALVEGRIGGAGLDVLTDEPPAANNPLLKLKLSNLIITPHMAWVSEQSLKALAEQLITNLEAFASGVPRNLVV